MIKPTVGRVVLFKPSSADHVLSNTDGQPLAAIVAHVWSDTCINLAVFDANGNSHSRTSVLLIQDDNPVPNDGYYAEWMPFQKGQATVSRADLASLQAQIHALQATIAGAK